MSSHSDPDLIDALRSGSADAFRRAYEAEKSCIYGLLLRLTGSAPLAADLFQNVWLKLVKHHARLRPDTNLRAWLCQVARNEWVSHRRAECVDLSRLFTLGLSSEGSSPEPTWDQVDLRRALEKLSDSDREVLVLSSVYDLTPLQVAESLAISEVALRQRLSRARQRLLKELDCVDVTPTSKLERKA